MTEAANKYTGLYFAHVWSISVSLALIETLNRFSNSAHSERVLPELGFLV